MKQSAAPTIFVVFGITGDLAQRKIIPALFNLYQENMLPQKFRIIGFSRRDWDQNRFKKYIRGVVRERVGRATKKTLEKFLSCLVFEKGYFGDRTCYRKLHDTLKALDIRIGVCANKLFHLAVPASSYETIFRHLDKSGLTKPCGGKFGWTRIIVEKPFGRDLKTAEMLDALLGTLYKEEQIFRIDHYLGKETLQNIVAFRFANTIFEPVWNKEHVESVDIILHEKTLVAKRGAFYHETGALRDIGQNHMMQTLALIAMEDPGGLDGNAIRNARANLLKSLEPIKPRDLAKRVALGQYQGFTAGPEVPKNSKTETYFKIRASIGNKRWKGVPVTLEAGKALKEDCKKIVITFKERPTCVCHLHDSIYLQNVLEFHIAPHEGISLKFWAKKKGFTMDMEPRELSFAYRAPDDRMHPHDAYEQLLFDVIRGEQTLFASTDEVQAAWKFITPILENAHSLKLPKYRPGSNGPE